MTEDAWKTVEEALVALPTILDRVLNATGPAAIAIGGVAHLFYFGLAILAAQMWRAADLIKNVKNIK
jgi:hypothetical protein